MRQDDNKLQELRDYARTAVLEPTVKEEEIEDDKESAAKKLNLFSKDVLSETKINKISKQEPKKIISKPKETPLEEKQDNKKTEKAPSLSSLKTVKQETKTNNDLEDKQKEDESVENKVEELFDSSLKIEATGEEQIDEEISSYKNPKQKNNKFKLNLLVSVFCCLVAIMGGWIIGNAVEIASTSSQIVTETQKGEEYSVNILKYLTKIGKLDDYMEGHPPSSDEGSLVPIEEIIPITPQPLEDTTAYQKDSNWFDKICNWFKNLFGG